MTCIVYLIHFEKPFGTARNGKPYQPHAQHYLGSTNNLSKRITQHSRGWGGRLMACVNESGIKWNVVKTWTFPNEQDGRLFEKHMKNVYKNNRKLCPVCNQRHSFTDVENCKCKCLQ